MAPKKTLEELVKTNLRYVGVNRLMAMEPTELASLAQLMKIEEVSCGGSTAAKIDIVDAILKKKSERKRPTSPLCKVANVGDVAAANAAARVIQTHFKAQTAVPRQSARAECKAVIDDVAKETSLLKKRHKLRVVAFNSLKLRLNAAALKDDWPLLMKTFSQFDVILVSEVPAEPSVKQLENTRAYGMKSLLDMYSHEIGGKGEDEAIEDRWQMAVSRPSGPGNLEVHTAFVKRPVELVRFCTNLDAGGLALDHAPLCCVVKDDRFESTDSQTWAFSSVHFPPKARHRQRDEQLKAFLGAYSTSADFRAGTPLTKKGAKDAKVPAVHHIVAGDYNCFPDADEFQLKSHGFAPPLLGRSISTSAGGCAYDNFIVSLDTEASFGLNKTVLELNTHARPSNGTEGVSDHSPILLSIHEMPTVKKKK